MNVATISMPRDKALEAYREYREAVRGNPANAEYRQIMQGYKALAKGKVLDLSQTLKGAGLDERARPRLAIARADWAWCYLHSSGGRFEFQATSWSWECRGRRRKIVVPDGTFTALAQRGWSGRALVPLIPPSVRPPHKLGNYHVLWEAAWEDVPSDPMLLRQISANLFAVLAVWDLTELERSVLRGRLGT